MFCKQFKSIAHALERSRLGWAAIDPQTAATTVNSSACLSNPKHFSSRHKEKKLTRRARGKLTLFILSPIISAITSFVLCYFLLS